MPHSIHRIDSGISIFIPVPTHAHHCDVYAWASHWRNEMLTRHWIEALAAMPALQDLIFVSLAVACFCGLLCFVRALAR